MGSEFCSNAPIAESTSLQGNTPEMNLNVK
jgi:hypothetical protein